MRNELVTEMARSRSKLNYIIPVSQSFRVTLNYIERNFFTKSECGNALEIPYWLNKDTIYCNFELKIIDEGVCT